MMVSRVFLFILFCVAVLGKDERTKERTKNSKDKEIKESGPFHSTLARTDQCKTSANTTSQPKALTLTIELYNTSTTINMMRGTLTAHRQLDNVMIKFKGFFWENGKWQLRYFFNHINCQGLIISALTKMVGVRVLGKTCGMAKDVYKFDGIDFNVVDHAIWMNNRMYGRILWRFHISNKRGIILCREFELVTVPV